MIKDRLALLAFDTMAAAKGYSFRQARTKMELADIDTVYGEEGFSFLDELKEKVKSYKKGTINFIAYYKNISVGTVRLADPDVVNRPYELYGVDIEGDHFEIQSLVVAKDHRDGTQFVMLGLFKAMYAYSVKNDIVSWSSCGARSVYLTMKRFCKEIEVEDIDFASISHPLTQYLYTNNIIDTYFTMEVAAFEPWTILKRCVRKMMKIWQRTELLPNKTQSYAGLNYRSK